MHGNMFKTQYLKLYKDLLLIKGKIADYDFIIRCII